jgi:plastocyanin
MPTRAVIAVLLAMTLAAGTLTPASGARVRIRAKADKTWDPAFKAVPKGTKVVWRNPTGVKHSVTATSGNWSKNVVIKPGTKTAKIFKRRGAYDYKCRFHKGMTGHIHVD